MSTSSSPARTFHAFPRLPTELRQKIYRHALFATPRIIPLKFRNFRGQQTLTGTTRPHALLLTNRDSRQYALSILLRLPFPGLKTTFVNPAIDYLFPNELTPLLFFCRENLTHAEFAKKIYRLAIPLKLFEDILAPPGHERSLTQLFRNLPMLEEIVLVRKGCEDTEWERDNILLGVEATAMDRDGIGSHSLLKLCMELYQPWRAFEGAYGKSLVEGALAQWVKGMKDVKREVRFRIMDCSVGERGERTLVEAGGSR